MSEVARETNDRPRLLRYGIEAPYVPAGLVMGGVACLVGAGFRDAPWLAALGAALLVQATLYLHTTVRGKVRVWERELDQLLLRGDERLLDLGCGRGAVLIAAARRLPTGQVVGVDLWRSKDQSGNDIGVTRANAETAGVSDRVELYTADMTELPFADRSFDVVTSALAIHNIPTAAGRHHALDEAMRVLRPGGRLLVADFRHTPSYREHLGYTATIRRLGPGYWYGGPWAATKMVTATKAVVRHGGGAGEISGQPGTNQPGTNQPGTNQPERGHRDQRDRPHDLASLPTTPLYRAG
jgi:ubiquinone/menaquinone biosynthesis C-methylase UbiE